MCDDDDWFEGEEFDDECESDDDDVTITEPCPECGAEVYEDTPRCPACGNYITHRASVWSGRPGWWILLGVVGVLATILVLAGLAGW